MYKISPEWLLTSGLVIPVIFIPVWPVVVLVIVELALIPGNFSNKYTVSFVPSLLVSKIWITVNSPPSSVVIVSSRLNFAILVELAVATWHGVPILAV